MECIHVFISKFECDCYKCWCVTSPFHVHKSWKSIILCLKMSACHYFQSLFLDRFKHFDIGFDKINRWYSFSVHFLVIIIFTFYSNLMQNVMLQTFNYCNKTTFIVCKVWGLKNQFKFWPANCTLFQLVGLTKDILIIPLLLCATH